MGKAFVIGIAVTGIGMTLCIAGVALFGPWQDARRWDPTTPGPIKPYPQPPGSFLGVFPSSANDLTGVAVICLRDSSEADLTPDGWFRLTAARDVNGRLIEGTEYWRYIPASGGAEARCVARDNDPGMLARLIATPARYGVIGVLASVIAGISAAIWLIARHRRSE